MTVLRGQRRQSTVGIVVECQEVYVGQRVDGSKMPPHPVEVVQDPPAVGGDDDVAQRYAAQRRLDLANDLGPVVRDVQRSVGIHSHPPNQVGNAGPRCRTVVAAF